MSTPAATQHMGRGTLQVLIAEGLVVPVGIVTAAYVGRTLGPDQYGLLAVAMAVATTIEWSLASLFTRATVQVVTEADHWAGVAAATLRLQTGLGVAGGLLLWLFAGLVADGADAPALATSLRLLALDLPIVAAASACRNVLTARARYRERALTTALRWVARLVFVVGFVRADLGINGAVLGEVLASLTWLAAGMAFARIPVFARAPGRGHDRLWQVGLPLFAIAMSLRVLERVGVFALKALGGSASEAGWYAAAQNFAIAPNLVAVSYSPILLGALTAMLRADDLAAARRLVETTLRLLVAILPFAAFGAGAAPEIVHLVFGPGYEPAARLAIPLLAGAVGMTMVSVASTALAAVDRATGANRLLWPLTVAAVPCLWIVVPTHGAMGTAIVVGGSAALGGVVLLGVVCRHWRVTPPIGTCLRAVAISAAVLAAGLAWPAYGFWLVAKTAVFTLAIGLAFLALGEFGPGDLRQIRALGRGARGAAAGPA